MVQNSFSGDVWIKSNPHKLPLMHCQDLNKDLFFVTRKKMSKRREKSIQWYQLWRKNISEKIRKGEILLSFCMTRKEDIQKIQIHEQKWFTASPQLN